MSCYICIHDIAYVIIYHYISYQVISYHIISYQCISVHISSMSLSYHHRHHHHHHHHHHHCHYQYHYHIISSYLSTLFVSCHIIVVCQYVSIMRLSCHYHVMSFSYHHHITYHHRACQEKTKSKYRTERKNRDAFRDLLRQHGDEGKITSSTFWGDYAEKARKCDAKHHEPTTDSIEFQEDERDHAWMS